MAATAAFTVVGAGIKVAIVTAAAEAAGAPERVLELLRSALKDLGRLAQPLPAGVRQPPVI